MGTEVKQNYSGSIDFDAASREFTIPIVPNRDLLDATLIFYGVPTMRPGLQAPTMQATATAYPPLGVADFRIFLNDYDVSSEIINELKRLVALLPREQLRSQYLNGGRAYLQLIQSLGSLNNETSNDVNVLNSIANTNDWPSQFNALGNRTAGWAGNLHPIHFIYRFMTIPPISLSRVWAAYRNAHDVNLPSTLAQLPLVSIAFTEGPPRQFNVDHNTPGGRIFYNIELHYKNPLQQPLEQILAHVKSLAMSVETIRTQYLEPVLSTAEQVNADLGHMEASLSDRLRQLKDTVSQIAPAP